MRSEVQVLLDPPNSRKLRYRVRSAPQVALQLAFRAVLFWLCQNENAGALAQLGERLICIQEVRSSILLGSTKSFAQQNYAGPAVECAALNERAKDTTPPRLDRQALSQVFGRPIGRN